MPVILAWYKGKGSNRYVLHLCANCTKGDIDIIEHKGKGSRALPRNLELCEQCCELINRGAGEPLR